MLTLSISNETALDNLVVMLILELKSVAYQTTDKAPALPKAYKGPALHNGKLVLYTLPVLLDYLEEVFPFPQLVPADPDLRAAMRQAAFRVLNGYSNEAELKDAAKVRDPFIFSERPTILDVVVACALQDEDYIGAIKRHAL